MAIDWGLAQGANIFADVAQGMEYGRELKERRDRKDAYKRAARDPAGGERALLEVGDTRGAEYFANREAQGKAQEAAQAKQRLEGTTQVLQALKGVPQGQRLQALQRQAPMLQRFGIDPVELLDGTTEEELSDQGIDLVTGQVTDAYKQFFQNDSGIYGVKPGGQVDQVRQFEQKPTIVPQGSVALGRDGKPIYTNPKTFAPQRAGGSAGLPPPPTGWRPVGR